MDASHEAAAHSEESNGQHQTNDAHGDVEQGERSKYTDFIVDHPYVVAFLSLFFAIIMLILWQSVVVKGEKNDASGGQFLAIDEIEVKRFLALEQSNKRTDETPVPVQIDTDDMFQLIVFYSSNSGTSGNIFTPQSIKEIYEVELGIQSLAASSGATITGFKDNCQLQYQLINGSFFNDPDPHCKKPFSVVNDIIFRLNPSFTAEDVGNLTQAHIDAAVANFSTPALLADGNDFFFAKDFSSTAGRSWVTRTSIRFGVPLKRFTETGARKYLFYGAANDADQWKDHTTWVSQYTDFFKAQKEQHSFTINYMELLLSNKEIGDDINKDFILAGVAGMAVCVLMVILTDSLFLGLTGMVNILMSYPIAMALYHGVLQIEIDTQLNLMALYIILGIGADDVFVFVDAWKQSLQAGPEVSGSLYTRMWWSWRRASLAMLVTSLTTFFAFVMTATSPIPSIGTFGIVSALMVLSMYLLVISWFPACVTIWHRWGLEDSHIWRSYCCCCFKPLLRVCYGAPPKNTRESQRDLELQQAGNSAQVHSHPDDNDDDDASKPRHHSSSIAPSHVRDVDISKYRLTERYFYSHFSPLLFKFKDVVIGLFVVLFIVALVGTAMLETPSEPDSGLPPESNLQKALDLNDKWFPPSAAQSITWKNYMFWGIQPDNPIDRAGIDRNDELNFGKLNLDGNFHLDNATQNYILSVCSRLANLTTSDGQRFASQGQVQCFMEPFRQWEKSMGLLEPLDYSDQAVAFRLKRFLNFTDSQGLQPNAKYAKDIGGLAGVEFPQRVTWVRIVIELPIDLNFRTEDMSFWFKEWASEMITINGNRPAGVSAAMQTSALWAFKVTFDRLISSTYVSIVAQFCVAVAILTITSRNWIVAAFAAVTIAGVVFSTLAVFVAAGSKLGFIEAIVALMLVGLSVDYCVHLANAFNETFISGRFYRSRAALLEMGVSVTSGAITTMTAAFFLLFTFFPFFQVFGKFVFATICISYAWATLFFMAMLMKWGPEQHPQGDIVPLLVKLRARCKAVRS